MEQELREILNIRQEQIPFYNKQFYQNDEFILIKSFFPKEFVDKWLTTSFQTAYPYVNRSYVPLRKKGGSLSSFLLEEKAPNFQTLYHFPEFMKCLQSIVDIKEFYTCPNRDPHACAIYCYEEPGDHIAFHYDSSFYKGLRYTTLVGIVDKHDRDSCKLVCHLYTKCQDRKPEILEVTVEPGDLIMFNGDRLWHAVSPMTDKPNQQRVILSLEYVSDVDMGFVGRAFSNVKDAVFYFGFSWLFKEMVSDSERQSKGHHEKESSSGMWCSNFLPSCS